VFIFWNQTNKVGLFDSEISIQTLFFVFSEINAAPHLDFLRPFSSFSSPFIAIVKFPLFDKGFVKQTLTTGSWEDLNVSIISGGKKSRFFSIKSRAS
jgi:hypothetical protein